MVTGEIDMDSHPVMQQVVEGLVQQDRVRALLTCRSQATRHGARLEIRRVQEPVRRVLVITEVEDLLGLPPR
jgi:hypothetical protein